MNIGEKGLIELNLVIPIGSSFNFEIELTDDNGAYIDLSDASAKMVFEIPGSCYKVNLSDCVTCTDTGVRVQIPYERINRVNNYVWDIYVYPNETESIRIAYGKANVVNGYAWDETR